MSIAAELKMLYRVAFAPVRGRSHAERLESFYGAQADGYDDFRKKLLHGREDLYSRLPTPEGGVWLELGGGTGSNLEYLGDRIRTLSKVVVVDLSDSLLGKAGQRVRDKGWTNVETLKADVTTISPGPVDVATFSYSLTMIPDWFAAIDRAVECLKPGGVLGVVDFYVSRKYPADGRVKHGWASRNLWPAWFGTDNVHPSPDHVPYLERRLETVHFSEHKGKVPYIPLARAPYYVFIGRKR